MLIISDRVKESSASAGSGSIVMESPFGAFQSFQQGIGNWWVKVGSGAWTNTGTATSVDLEYTMPSDTLKVWPDHFCILA